MSDYKKVFEFFLLVVPGWSIKYKEFRDFFLEKFMFLGKKVKKNLEIFCFLVTIKNVSSWSMKYKKFERFLFLSDYKKFFEFFLLIVLGFHEIQKFKDFYLKVKV